MKISILAATTTATIAATIAVPAAAHGDPTPPCSDGQVQVNSGGLESASGHRSQPASAVVEGVGFDPRDLNRSCPTYTDLRVTAPDTTHTVTVPAHIDTCELQIHPVDATSSP